MIYTVTLNPALDKTVEIPRFTLDAVNRVTRLRLDPGGKGLNVSKVIARLGGKSCAFGLLGGSAGRMLEGLLAEYGFECRFRYTEGETRTNLKVADLVTGTHTDLNEPGAPVSEALLDALLHDLTAALAPGDIVVLSGSLPVGAPADTYRTWGAACRTAGARVFLDADGAPLAEGIQAAPQLIKPNEDELSRLMGRPLGGEDALCAAARELIAKGTQQVVVSMGGKGALFVTADSAIRAEGLRVPVGSTVGAGDSMVAALAYAADRGLAFEDAVVLSMATGAANVMCSGTQAAEREAVEALMPRVVWRLL